MSQPHDDLKTTPRAPIGSNETLSQAVKYLDSCLSALEADISIPEYDNRSILLNRKTTELMQRGSEGMNCWLFDDPDFECPASEFSLAECNKCGVFKNSANASSQYILEGIKYLSSELNRKKQEQALTKDLLEQSEDLARLGQQVSAVNHELNNIIGSIMGYAQLAKLTGEEQDIHKFIEISLQASQRAKVIIQSLRTASKCNKKKMGIQHVPEILDMVVSHISRDMGKDRIVIHRKYSDVPWVITDPINLQRVFLSICSHLANDLDDEGKIDLSIRHRGEWLEIRISGEAPRTEDGETRQLTFDAFYPKSSESSTISSMSDEKLQENMEILSALGGDLQTQSKNKNKRVFTIRLPLG